MSRWSEIISDISNYIFCKQVILIFQITADQSKLIIVF